MGSEFALYLWRDKKGDGEPDNSDENTLNVEELRAEAHRLISGGEYQYAGIWRWNYKPNGYEDLVEEFTP
jgi:hypothetical protein